MTFKMMASLFTAAALTVSAPALAKDCTGLEGKDLKTCEKENKQDDRSVAYMPSKLDGSLSAYDAAEKNPFATDAYRVRVTEAGLTSVDGYLEKAFRLQATMQFAKFVVDEAGERLRHPEERHDAAGERVELVSGDGRDAGEREFERDCARRGER